MKLLIISHTEHYKTANGQILGWGPTVTEINHLTEVFDEIEHIAMLQKGTPPRSALPYTSNRIKFTEIPSVGGPKLKHKINSIVKGPRILSIIKKSLSQADVFQFRAPTGIGVYVIPYLILCTKKKGWFKYAGNWNQEKPPLGYRLQRWFLKQQSRKVTINGRWPKQPKHCLSFENPCLMAKDLIEGQHSTENKSWKGALELCYVGRLESPKGVGRILEALKQMGPDIAKRISVVHLIGDGEERTQFEDMASKLSIPVQFYGYLARQEVFEIYKKSHYFLMPTTASEGFPKVLAEAYNFGCIPLVSDISSIGQYIKEGETGFIVTPPTPESLVQKLTALVNRTNEIPDPIYAKRPTFVKAFSFAHYNQRISNEILKIK